MKYNINDNGHTNVVKLLLKDSRVDPSEDDNYSIEYASYNKHMEIIKLLLQDHRVRKTLTLRQIEMYPIILK